MRVVHVVHSFYPIIGGIEIVVQKTAEEQVKLGHEVHVLTSNCGVKNEPSEDIINGVHIHRIGSLKLIYPDLTIPRKIPRDLLKNADIIHVHSQNSLFGVMVAKASRDLGTRVVAHMMAVDSLKTHPNIIKRSLGYALQRKLTETMIGLANLKLVKSLRDLNILKSKYGISATYVPDGIDDKYLTTPSNPELFRRSFEVKWGRYVLYIGRLHKAKGPQILIRALPHLLKEIGDIGAVFIGPGDQKWLKSLASRLGVERHVLFTGKVSEEIKISAIDGSTSIVVPSLYDYVEVFSLVTSEAWARKKPVVASTVGELPYRIKHGVNGLLVPPNDPKALAGALANVTKARGFEISETLYTWRQISKRLCDLYERTLK